MLKSIILKMLRFWMPESWLSPCKTIDNNIEKDTGILAFSFKVLTLSGLWLPLHWRSKKYLKIAYQIYSAIVVLSAYTIMGLQTMLLVNDDMDMNFFTDIMFTWPTGIAICCKMLTFIVRRNQMCHLREMLTQEWCEPRDDKEIEMQRKTDKFIKDFTVCFNVSSQLTLFSFLLVPLWEDSSTRQLPVLILLPHNLNNTGNFWIVYGLEIVPMIICILLNVTTDTIFMGFVLQACTQFDFLKYRINQLPKLVREKKMNGQSTEEFEENSINEIAMHHEFLIKFMKEVTATFNVIVIEQYINSVLLFSVIVYQFTLGNIPILKKIMAFGYIICMTAELFAYCWSGNEITLKDLEFGDAIYEMDWNAMSKKSIKKLRFIMLRTTKPIVMSYGGVIKLNIDSFKAILKVTYSAFNVLKKSTAH